MYVLFLIRKCNFYFLFFLGIFFFLGTVHFGIHYSSGGTPLLVGFTNSDWVGDHDDWKSIVGYVFSIGSLPITWACKKQKALALSSAKVDSRVWLMQFKKACAFDRSFHSFNTSSNIQPHYGVTIKVPSSSLNI
jgi:hypothetical protein